MEEWRPVKGYEGLYEVSNLGVVRSLCFQGHGGMKDVTQKAHNKGYLHIHLYKDGKCKAKLVHRIVAEAFVDGYQEGFTVNHIDENKTNNRAENLEWCSARENCRKYVANHPNTLENIKNGGKGNGRGFSMTPIIQCDADGNIVREWASPVTVRKALGWSDWSIKECCRGNRKTAYGYTWHFA